MAFVPPVKVAVWAPVNFVMVTAPPVEFMTLVSAPIENSFTVTAPVPEFFKTPLVETVPKALASVALVVMFPLVDVIVPLAPVTLPEKVIAPAFVCSVPLFVVSAAKAIVPPVDFIVREFMTGPVAVKSPLRVIVPELFMASKPSFS